MTIPAGTRLGTYEITALLGAGGMGEVYRARDARLGRDVALKVLAPRLSNNRDAVARFEQEARSASALSHPHILHIYDIGDASVEGEPLRYMTMELVDGATLAAKIGDSAELLDLIGWLVQVADGLAKAHDAGIVHRDLKPDNVMVTRDGYAKILDFGLAKLVEQPIDTDAATLAGVSPKSIPGMIMGTVAYMAPEQAQGKPADARSDIFAFGCMLYEAAARRRAFGGASLIDTLHQIVHADPDFAGLDPQLARIARKCLAKDPDARYPSIRDVARELRAITNPQPAKAVVKSEERTIAVLPFDDLSPTRDNDYFAEGLAEEITSDLSKVRALRVISRASARKYRGEEKDISKVATELGADFVIDGSVRKAGNQLRVIAQLIDTATRTQLWSDKYSGTLDDVFDIQEDVARAVVERLKVELTSTEDALLGDRSMSNVEAYECYLRARRYYWRFDQEGLSAALKEIERGLAVAGPNPALLGAQGTVYWQYYNLGIDPNPAHLDRAEEIARTILETDPRSLHGLRLTGLVAMHKQQLGRAVEYLERTLEVDPNDLDALLFGMFVRAMVGRDVKAMAERLVAIDPLAAFTWAMQAIEPVLNGRPDEAIRLVHRAAALEPVPIFDIVLMQAILLAGRNDEARTMLRTMQNETVFGAMARALGHAALGEHDTARTQLTGEMLEAARGDMQYSELVAETYALLGETDLAFDWLENAIVRGFIAWPFLARHDSLLAPLRSDARFEPLVERARVEWQSFH